MRKIASFLSVFVVCFLVLGPAQARAAAPITPQGATELKKLIEDHLQWHLDLAKIAGKGLAMDNAFTVTPKDSFYEISFPGISFNTGPQGNLKVGTIVLRATPGEKGAWLVSGALPSSMTFYDQTNAPAAELSIGKQKFAAVWEPEHEMWPRVDALYQDIKLKGLKQNIPAMTLGTVSATVDMKDNGDKTWSGTTAFEGSDIALESTATPAAKISIAKITSATSYDRLDTTQQEEIRKSLMNLTAGGKTPTEAEIKNMLGTIMSKATGIADNMKSSFDMTGFSVQQKDAVPPQQPMDFSFDKVSLRSNLLNARKEKVDAGFSGSFEGIKMPFVSAGFSGLVPQKANIELHMNSLPLNQIISTMAGALASAADQTAVREAAMGIPKLLQDNGTSLSIENTYSKSADLDTDVAGKIDATANTALGVTGKVTVTMKKLDEAVQKLRDLAVKPGADLRLMGYANSLAVMQMMGKAEQAADGTPARVYNFEITPDGKMLLNGVNFKAMVGPKTEPAAATPSPAVPAAVAPPAPTPAAPAAPMPATPAAPAASTPPAPAAPAASTPPTPAPAH